MICQRDNPAYFTLNTTDLVIKFVKRSGLLPPRARPLSPGNNRPVWAVSTAEERPIPWDHKQFPTVSAIPSLPSGRGRWGRPFIPEVIRELIRSETAVGARLLR